MSANEFNPHPFEGLIEMPKSTLPAEDRTRSWVPEDIGKSRGILHSIPQVDVDPHAMKRELRELTKGKLGPVSRLTSPDAMRRTLAVLDETVPTTRDGGKKYAENTGRVKKAIFGGIAAIGLGAGGGLLLGIATDELNNPNNNMPTPQMPYDGQDMMLDGVQPLHDEPSKATIPVSGEEHA